MEKAFTLAEQVDHYRKEIAKRSPPRNRQDRFMIEVYRHLLKKNGVRQQHPE